MKMKVIVCDCGRPDDDHTFEELLVHMLDIPTWRAREAIDNVVEKLNE